MLLDESKVLAEEIDSLGHMNVRFYMERMERANRKLLSDLELPSELMAKSFVRRTDTYTRFRAEQFEGSTLHTVGGILDVTEGGMRSYVEIRNPDLEQSAATFIVTTGLIDRKTRVQQPFPLVSNAALETKVPDYAQPRTLSLGLPQTDVTFDDLIAAIPDEDLGSVHRGRYDTTVEEGDVDQEGWLKPDAELMFLPFSKMAAQTGVQHGPPVFETESGQRVGWAVMETRTQTLGQPKLGDHLQYFNADVALEKKSRVTRRWAFNSGTGQLVGMSDTVGICIDLDARKAIDWPDELRVEIEAKMQPQFA